MASFPPLSSVAENAVVLKGSELKKLRDQNILSFLFAAYQQMRELPIHTPVEKTFISELLTHRLLTSAIPDVSQLALCVLCDVVRVCADSLPFPTTRCLDVLHGISQVFNDAVRHGDVVKRCQLLVERLSATHLMSSLLPHCSDISEVQSLLLPLFQALPAAAASATPTTVAGEWTRLLVEVIQATDTVTVPQLSILVGEVSKALSSRRRRPLASSEPFITPFSAAVASRVLVDCLDYVRFPFKDSVLDQLTRGITAAAATDAEHVEQRRAALTDMSHALLNMVAVTELHPDFIQGLIPVLSPLLDHDSPEIRLLLLRGLTSVYTCSAEVIPAYRTAFEQFLTHINDVKPTIRVEMIQCIRKIVTNAKTTWAASAGVRSATLLSELWPVFFPLLESRLVDPQPMVRREAVAAFADCLAVAPELADGIGLEDSLGLRTADKHPKVRETALERFSQLYRGAPQKFPWIPNAVLLSTQAEDGMRSVESVLESLLPLEASEGPGKPKSSKAGKDTPLFEFEVPSAAQTSDPAQQYIEGWLLLCSHLSSAAFQEILKLTERKVAMRSAVTALYQLRQQLAECGTTASEVKSTAVHNIHRLLSFLQTSTGACNNEWDSLFRCKDAKVSHTLLRFCREDNEDWEAERVDLLRDLKGRVDTDAFLFVQRKLIPILSLPLRPQHLQQLLIELSPSSSRRFREEAVLRVVHIFLLASPSCVHASISTLSNAFLDLMLNHSERATGTLVSILDEQLNILKEVPVAVDRLVKANMGKLKKPVPEFQINLVLKALGQLCTGDVPFMFHSGDGAGDVVAKLCKKAAKCLWSISGMTWSGIHKEKKTVDTVSKTALLVIQKGFVPKDSVRLIASLKTLYVLVSKLPEAVEERSSVLQCLAKILDSVTDVKNVVEAVGLGSSRKTEEVRLQKAFQLAGIVADCAAKTLSCVALSTASTHRSAMVGTAVELLLRSLKALSNTTAHGASFVRLALLQQLVKLGRLPAASVQTEVTVAVLLSSEEDAIIRRVLQTKMVNHIRRFPCDMRYVAVLLLFALHANGKSEYQEVKQAVQKVGDHLRKKQSLAGGISLSSEKALGCYLEYSIPFLILFMAHHTQYAEQEKQHFFAFQRVWHLVLEELLRHGLQCVSFVRDLLSRIKHSKDTFQPDSDRPKLLADLGLLILQHLLSTYDLGTDALKRYPGAILIPSFFQSSPDSSTRSSEHDSRLSGIHIPAHVPFRLPQQSGTSPQETPRASPASSARTSTHAALGLRTPESRKRERSPTPVSSSESPPQRRTQPMPVELSRSLNDDSTPSKILDKVQSTVDKLTRGLTKKEIAQIRWKEIKNQIEGIPLAMKMTNVQVNMEELLNFAKSKLREKYSIAKDR